MNNCYLDAEAVITFFRMTGRKHIFITGSRGRGKSHLVNNMLKHMSDSFNLLQSHRTDTPQVVIKSNLVADNKEFVIGVPRTSGINPASNTLFCKYSLLINKDSLAKSIYLSNNL